MNEISLVRAIQRYSGGGKADSSLVAGIGDDCAIIRPRAGEDLLFTTDYTIEGVHFRRATQSGKQTGYKAMARGLSDIAAMGGVPRFALISLALAPWTTQFYVCDLYKGFAKLTDLYGVRVIGGDVTRGVRLAIDVIVIGAVPRGKALRRNGARPGDLIYVSGPLGRAAARDFKDLPEPRIELGQMLRPTATACMDLSDGLSLDLHRLCVESGVAADLFSPLPLAPKATLDHALYGGEDYELLCTIPAGRKAPAPFTQIGVIRKGRPGRLSLDGVRLHPRGWDPL
jgi:thiamine-monophosphate kinase